MTIIHIDVSPGTYRAYQDEAARRGVGVQDLAEAVLAAQPFGLVPAAGPGAYYTPEPLAAAIESGTFVARAVNPMFTPNEYTLLAHDDPIDFPSGAGY